MIRRRFLTIGASAALAALPRVSVAQPRIVRLGAIHPVSGPFADLGLACRLGVQLAVDAVNAAGGIASLVGARLELLVADSAASAGAQVGAERLIAAGARILTGALHSNHTAAVAEVARRRRVPFLVDTAVADATTATTAGGGEPVFVFRNFPTTSAFAHRAVQYLVELFAEAKRPLTRVALLHTTDPLGTTQARRLEAAYAALRPSFELPEFVPISPRAASVTTEVAKLRALAPDVLLLAVRSPTVGLLYRYLARDPIPVAATLSLGTPGLADAARAAGVAVATERVMELAAWPNLRNARTQHLAAEFTKRAGGRPLDASAGYAYEAVLVVADAIERAGTVEPPAIAQALTRTSFASPFMVSAGPIVFDDHGNNPNAAPALLQIFGGRPSVVWPKPAAERPYAILATKP
jgi:branched-chain amino acid transport system substrate-binding protein